MSRPAVSRHFRVLRDAGLVRLRRDRQTLHYSLNPALLAEIARWPNGYRLDGLQKTAKGTKSLVLP